MMGQTNPLEPRAVPTMYFIGVTTTKSSIMRVFPKWSDILDLGAEIVGYDAPIHALPETYRSIIRHIKKDPLSMGALVTTHKIDLLDQDAHGIYIDSEDNVYCTEHSTHCVYEFSRHGELVMKVGTSGQPAERDGDPFNQPTDLAIASTGELFVSDGYGNARVHKFSPDGELLLWWGERGTGSGQFALSHCVRVDKRDHIWVCDRENDRIQIFDTNGNFLTERIGLRRPSTIFFDPNEDVVYIAELDYQVSIYTHEGGYCPHGNKT